MRKTGLIQLILLSVFLLFFCGTVNAAWVVENLMTKPDDGTLADFSGTSTDPDDYLIYGAYGADYNSIFAVGAAVATDASSAILKWDGTEWSSSYKNLVTNNIPIYGIYGWDDGEMKAVGGCVFEGPTYYQSSDGGVSWTTSGPGFFNWTSQIWGPTSSDVYAAGMFYPVPTGVLMNWPYWVGPGVDDYAYPVALNTPAAGGAGKFMGVHGTDASNVWGCGRDGVLVKKNGGSWDLQTTGTTAYLYQVYAADANIVWAVGDNGQVLLSTDAGAATPTWTNVFDAKVQAEDTNKISEIVPAGSDFRGVRVDSEGRVFLDCHEEGDAAAAVSYLIVYDGTAWTKILSPGDTIKGGATHDNVLALIWGSSKYNMYVGTNISQGSDASSGFLYHIQLDTDGDGILDDGDFSDAGDDAICPDSVTTDCDDNCPAVSNPGQEDADNDGVGDDCDVCPNDADNDADSDGVCGDADNCPDVANPDQIDCDNDGLGDACDPVTSDFDGDGIDDACDSCPYDFDNDADSDGVCGDVDNCPNIANPNQGDYDNNGTGDACDAGIIFGTITGAVPGIKVDLVASSCGGDFIYDTDRTNSEGYYLFESIPQGFYIVLPRSLYVNFGPIYGTIQIPQTEIQSYDFTVTGAP